MMKVNGWELQYANAIGVRHWKHDNGDYKIFGSEAYTPEENETIKRIANRSGEEMPAPRPEPGDPRYLTDRDLLDLLMMDFDQFEATDITSTYFATRDDPRIRKVYEAGDGTFHTKDEGNTES